MARTTAPRTPRLRVLALVVALLGAVGLTVGYGPQPAHAVGAGNVLKRWVMTQAGPQTVTQAQAVAAAQNYDVIVARKSGTFTPFLAAMRAANPSLKVLVYLNGAYAQSTQGPSSASHYDLAWYAKDANGNYITTRSGQTDSEGDTGNWLMDVSNAGWVQDRASTCTQWMSQTQYDGCYVDMLGNPSVDLSYVTSLPVHQDTTTSWTEGQVWTAPQWLDATSSLGTAVKNTNSTRMVVGNGLQNGRQYFITDQGPTSKLVTAPSTLDGGNAQGWIRGTSDAINAFDGGGPNGDRDWKRDINLLVDAGSKGRSAMAMTKVWNVTPTPTQDQVDAVHRFTLASFLLGTDGNQYFLFDDDPTDGAAVGDHPYDHVDVGTPTESSPCTGSDTTCTKDPSGAYVRHFTKGTTVVNPTNVTVTVPLGAPMANLEGAIVSQVTLPPDTGDVFTLRNASLGLNPSSIPADHASTSTATVTITDADGHGVTGQPVTFSTSGDVTFGPVHDNGNGTYTSTVTASTTPGDETITAHDGALGATASLSESGPTATAMTTSAPTSTYGTAVTFTATVTSPSGRIPTGTVKFFDGAVQIGSASLGGTGRAQISTASLTGGKHSITAGYQGDGVFGPSTSPVVTQTVSAARTTSALASTPNPSPFGSSVTLTATVTSAAGTPTGTVTFRDGATTIGSSSLDGTGRAQLSTTSLSVGTHTLGAAYGGDVNFSTSSATHSQTVSKAATSTAVSSSSNPASYGTPVTFTATVTGGAGTPTGTVTFKANSTTIGTASLDGAGTARLTFTPTKVSTSITATYGGNGSYLTSTAPAFTQSVVDAPSAVSLTSSSASVTAPNTVTFTATVTGSAGVPTGSVTFYDGSSPLATVALSSGKAKLTVALPAGGHVIMASYGGDAHFASRTSPMLFERVNRVGAMSSSITLANTPNPSTAGQPVTLRAKVSGTGAPTGTVWFFDKGALVGSASVDATGYATFITSSLSAGTHSITAGYGGDATFNPSVSTAHTQTVNS